MKKILMIGAGFLQTYVIKRAKELGYYVYALDGSASAPGFQYADEYAAINIVDQEACLAYAKDKQIDGVLTAATEYGVLTASYIAKQLGLPGIDYKAVSTVKNKYLTRKALMEAHADDTKQAYQITNDREISDVQKNLHFPVMVKPCDGSGSRGAAKAENAEEFAAACKTAMNCSLSHKVLVESFIVGKEYGAESFVYNGHITVMAIMRKWMTNAPYYAELGHSIPSCLDKDTENYIKECVENAIRALKIDFGSVNMDLLLSEDGTVHIVDIGARMGGNLIGSDLIPTGTGIDYIRAMLCAAAGDPVQLEPQGTPKCIVTRLLALTPGIVKDLPNFEAIEQKMNVKIHHHLAVNDEIREYHTNLDGCGYVVAVADDYDTALKNAEAALDTINQEIVRK